MLIKYLISNLLVKFNYWIQTKKTLIQMHCSRFKKRILLATYFEGFIYRKISPDINIYLLAKQTSPLFQPDLIINLPASKKVHSCITGNTTRKMQFLVKLSE